MIDHVAPGSVASAKGLKVGDRVLSVQGQDAKHISGDQVTHYMMQRPLHMVTLTEDRLEIQPPSSPASSPAARPSADLSHMQSALEEAETRLKFERDEAVRSLEAERSTRQAVEAQLNEERTARQAMETQLRELMSQAQSLQTVNGELRRALETLEAAQRHQTNAATARTMQTDASAPLVDKQAALAPAPAPVPAPNGAATMVTSATSIPRKYRATLILHHLFPVYECGVRWLIDTATALDTCAHSCFRLMCRCTYRQSWPWRSAQCGAHKSCPRPLENAEPGDTRGDAAHCQPCYRCCRIHTATATAAATAAAAAAATTPAPTTATATIPATPASVVWLR